MEHMNTVRGVRFNDLIALQPRESAEFIIDAARYFELKAGQEYVIGGMLKVYLNNGRPLWIPIDPFVFVMPPGANTL
jgi:hypothetical protein